VAVALSVAEVALALLLMWPLLRSDFARQATRSIRFAAGPALVLVAMGACVALFVFVLAYWQWRLSGRARVRLLLAIYLSLLFSFCGLCWHDVSVRTAELARGAQEPVRRVIEQTAAASVAIGSLLVGLAAVTAVLWVERRSLNRQG
jgi:hypothetical protein